MHRRRYLTGVAAGTALLAGCGEGNRSDPGGATGSGTSLALEATPFDDGERIPARYTCEGGDVNPELTVSGVVEAVETLSIIVDDPGAGDKPFVHWLLWNVPADTETIPRSVAKQEAPPFAAGARQGTNDADVVGYTGPCPPTGDDAHTYRFRLVAVDTELELTGGASRSELDEALSGQVVDSVTLTGTYERN
jgi:hypothetical protein